MCNNYQDNIAQVFDKTFENRAEGAANLRGIDISLETGYDDTSHPKAWENYQGDPVLKLASPIHVVFVVAEHKKKGQVVPEHVAEYDIQYATLFSSTGKMSAASFSVPAGPSRKNGTCPASALPTGYDKHLGMGEVDQRPIRQDDLICRSCYSAKSNYMHRPSQYQQLMRYFWLKRLLDRLGETGAAKVLASAVRAHQGNAARRRAQGDDPRFFRIHDSGDIWSPAYYRMWIGVCEIVDEVQFWCPTRTWVLPYSLGMFAKHRPPANLALRPSALHFDDLAPSVEIKEGVAQGSTSHYWETKAGGIRTDPIKEGIADWPCPAYAKGGHTCAGALLRAKQEWPANWVAALKRHVKEMSRKERELTSNGADCRVCWLRRDMRVSYKAH